MEKIAMILGDGGVKAGFIAGAADAILNNLPNPEDIIKVMVGTSASSGNVIYYLSYGENHPGEKMWTTILADKRFINFDGLKDIYSARPLYDLDFMIEQIFKVENPIDPQVINSHKIKFVIPVLEKSASTATYFTNDSKLLEKYEEKGIQLKSSIHLDLYELIKASSAAPLIYDRTVGLDGKEYLDAAAIEPLPLDLPGVSHLKKVIILTKGKIGITKKLKYVLTALLFILLVYPFKRQKLPLKHYIQYAKKPFLLNKKIKIALKEEKRGNAVVIYPKEKIGGITDNDETTLKRTYEMGVEAAKIRLNDIIKLSPIIQKSEK